MRPFLDRLILCLALLMPAAAFAAPTILVYGDSLSAAYGIPVDKSWVHLLQNKLAASGYRHVVANASISGETTSGGLTRIQQALKTHQPELVILELGANDGLRGLPVQAMRQNLNRMIETCRQHGADVLLVGMRLPPNYGPKYATAFFESFPELAARHQLPLVDFLLSGVAGNRELTQEDGLHPNAQAQPRILQNVWQTLQPMLAKTTPRQATR